jgi:hypothetical protein
MIAHKSLTQKPATSQAQITTIKNPTSNPTPKSTSRPMPRLPFKCTIPSSMSQHRCPPCQISPRWSRCKILTSSLNHIRTRTLDLQCRQWYHRPVNQSCILVLAPSFIRRIGLVLPLSRGTRWALSLRDMGMVLDLRG